MKFPKQFISVGLLSGAALLIRVNGVHATDAIWENQTIYSGPPPQIDATAFVNEGYLNFFIQRPAEGRFTSIPFETLNTLYYTNTGDIFSQLGLRLDYSDGGSIRKPAASFYNSGQLVGADDVDQVSVGGIFVPSGVAISSLTVNATNVVNRGLLEAGETGKMQVVGDAVNLTRSGVRVGPNARTEPPAAVFSDRELGGGTQYVNAPGVTDFYWNVDTNVVNISTNYLPPRFMGPQHSIFTNLTTGAALTVALPGPVVLTAGAGNYPWATPPQAAYRAFSYTNSIGGSNALFQTVIVPTTMKDGEITAAVRWSRLDVGNSTNLLLRAAGIPSIRIDVGLPDPIFGRLSNPIYVTDFSLVRSNLLATNLFANTRKPRVISVSRAVNRWWSNGIPSLLPFNPGLYVWGPTYSNTFVSQTYSAYAANMNEGSATTISNLYALAVPESSVVNTNPYAPLALFDPTNKPGRVEIVSKTSLDLRKTKLYSQNFLRVSAPHVEHDAQTILDAPYMSLDIGSTNGTLNVENLVGGTVKRLEGKLFIHSATWSNAYTFGTNLVTTLHHVLMIDPEDLVADKDITIFEARMKADNLILRDRVRSVRELILDATNIVVYGALQPALDVTDLGPANMPRLNTFTNYSTNSLILGLSDFGRAPAPVLSSWHNEGRWFGFSHRLHATRINNPGELIASRGNSLIEADDTFDARGGVVSAQKDIRIKARHFLAAGSELSAGGFLTYTQFVYTVPGSLEIDVSDSVDDGGAAENNMWKVSGGFQLLTKPATGDLLGTTIISEADKLRQVDHVWAGVDRGPSLSGYVNNMALKRLILDGTVNNLMTFGPVTGNNALYTEFLEFRNGITNDLASNIEILPGMKIYFGGSNLDPSYLEGLFGGSLVYLPNSASAAIQLQLGENTVTVTKALISSMVVDSDGDGIVNGLDTKPFDGVTIYVENLGENNFIWWNGAARMEYTLQYRDGIKDSTWTDLRNVYSGSVGGLIGTLDQAESTASRFYRVIYTP